MKLGELLETIGDRTIYIGAGGAFLVAGVKSGEPLPVARTPQLELQESPPLFQPRNLESDFDKFVVHRSHIKDAIDRMDETLLSRNTATREDLMARIANFEAMFEGEKVKDTPEIKKARKRLAVLETPKPLMEREVKETYERTTEDALNIIVEGTETGKIWSIYEARPFVAEYNLHELVGEIFRDTVRGYRANFQYELEQWENILTQIRKTMKQSKGYEKYLHYLTGDDVTLKGKTERIPSKLFAIIDADKIIDQAQYQVVMDKIRAETRKEKP